MHTKEMIMNALQSLHDNYDPVIKNPSYRGPMEKIPSFTIKEIVEVVGRSVSTVRKWLHVLDDEGLIEMGYRRCYFANDPITYVIYRLDAKPIKLKEAI